MSETSTIDRFVNRPAVEQRFRKEITAFMAPYLPTNPLPFLHALTDGCQEEGAGWIQSDAARALLHMLLQMARGQVYRIDSDGEFFRLLTVFEP